MAISISSCENSGIPIGLDSTLSDFDYADEVVLLNDNSGKFQVFLDYLEDGIGVLRMRLSPRNCKLLLQVKICSKPNLFPAVKQLGEINAFSYLSRYILFAGIISH